MRVTWDERKNVTLRKKHGVSFDEAREFLSSDGQLVMESSWYHQHVRGKR